MALFFSNIQETFGAFMKGKGTDGKAFGAPANGSSRQATTKKDAIGRIAITIILLALAAWLLNDDKKSQMASTIIGAAIGYWLK